MEILFEILVELILEGTFEISKNRKVPKFIRYPLIFLIVLLFLGVAVLIFYTGVLVYQKINKFCGIFLIVLGIAFVIGAILNFKKEYLRKKKGIVVESE